MLLVAIAAAAAAVFWWRGSTARPGPIVLISIDTLRADRLPAYGYTKVATPAIDALAAGGVVFERAYAHSPQTLPSHTSMLTGLLPYEHGVRDNIGFTVRANQRMLQHVLAAHGYEAAAFVSSFVLRADTRIGQGFAVYDSEMPESSPGAAIGQVQRDGHETLARAERWLESRQDGRFFLFLHLYEPHTPYRPPERFAHFDPYDGEIAYADEIVGALVTSLRRRNLYDAATIVLLSDHGEGLGDHGEREHGVFIYDETIRVPFIAKLAGGKRAGRRITHPVQHVDLAPTLIELAGAPPLQGVRGRSLKSVLEGGTPPSETGIYSESLYPRYHFGWSELTSLTDERYRYIKAPRPELYDLAGDPEETRNLTAERPQTAAAMRAALDGLTAGREIDKPAAVSAEAREQFQALGYIGMQASGNGDLSGESLADPKDKVRILEQYRRAIDLANERKFADAVPILRGIVAAEPGMADVWQQLGNILSRLGRHAQALDAFRRFVELKPGDTSGLVLVAGTLLRLGRLDDAWAHARLAEKVAPEHDQRARGSAHEMAARVALARKDYTGAKAAAQRAHAADPSLPMPDYVQARIHHAEGRYAEAWPYFERALQQLESRTMTIGEIHYYAGDTLARLGRNAEAEAQFRKEVQLFPQSTRGWSALAMLYRSLARDADAERAIAGMLQRSPTPDAYGLAAQLWTMFGEAERAAAVRATARQRFGAQPPDDPR